MFERLKRFFGVQHTTASSATAGPHATTKVGNGAEKVAAAAGHSTSTVSASASSAQLSSSHSVSEKQEKSSRFLSWLPKLVRDFFSSPPQGTTQTSFWAKLKAKITFTKKAPAAAPLTEAQRVRSLPHAEKMARLNTMIDFLKDKDRLKIEGLLRVGGLKDKREELNKNLSNPDKFSLGDCEDVHVVASAMKLFIRDCGIFDKDGQNLLVAVCLLDEEKWDGEIKKVIAKLSPEQREMLALIVGFLQEVAAKVNTNKMGVSNLAIVFGPNFIVSDDKSNAFSVASSSNSVTEKILQLSPKDINPPPADNS